MPAELRALIDRCLAKDPGQRPTAAGVLAEAGGTQPLPGWLPARLTRAFTALPDLPAAVPTPTVVNPELASAFAQTRVGRAQPGSPLTVTAARMQPEWAAVEQPRRDQRDRPGRRDRAGRRVRRGLLRPLAVASIVAGLIGASAATGFALTGNGHPPVVHTPQMAAAAQTTSPATPAPSATQTSYQPACPAPSTTPATTIAPSPSATPTQTMSPAPATSAAPTPTATPTQTQTVSPAPATSAAPTPHRPGPGADASPGPGRLLARTAQCPKASRWPGATSGACGCGCRSRIFTWRCRSSRNSPARSRLNPFLTTILSTAVSVMFSGNV